MPSMDRFPIIITIGAALLGFLAGEMILTDPVIPRWFGGELSHTVVNIAGAIGAAIVVAVGLAMQRRARAQVVDQKSEQEARLPARH